MSSKFGPENTIGDVLTSSVWRGVSKTVEGRQAMVNDAFEDLTIETGTKIRLKVTGSAPGKLPRNTTPAIDSFLSDYRLVTPGIPGTCKITPTPPAPVIVATPAVAADASATVPSVDLPAEDVHYVRGTDTRTVCNRGRGLVKYVDDSAKAGCTACRAAVGLEPIVRIHSATPMQTLVIGGSGIGWINGQKGPELHQHQGMPVSLTFGAPSPLSSGAAMAAATGPQSTNPLHHVDWTTPARPAFAVPPVAEQLEGLRVVAAGYETLPPGHKIRPIVIAFVGDGNNLDAKQMRHLVEHTKLPIPITFGRITIGSVVALEFTSTGPVRNVTADLELIGPWQQAPLRNKSLGLVKNDPQSPRLYALLIPSTEASDATATSAAPPTPPSPPVLTLDLPPMSAHTSDEAIVLALGMPESEADTLRALAAEASAGMADFGVSLTLEQYIRGLLRTEARRTGLVAEKAKPNGAPPPALRPYPAPFPGPHTPSA
jgi:hypothetical protein